ncbi:MAG: VOC family protein [Deltaproteobacteria bacterium]|nr:VOC family protein [Deltaproteobacteria bacterium]MBW2413198.1 VOC family protein [Deltaproteobacteria bacterium]
MSEPSQAAAQLTHVAVRTHDIDASIAFYQKYAGLHLVHEREDDGIRVVWLSHEKQEPELAIVLLSMPHERVLEPPPCDHLGFAVESREAVDRIADLAREDGVLKLAPLHAGEVAGYLTMVRDPSGNTCEFSHGQALGARAGLA